MENNKKNIGRPRKSEEEKRLNRKEYNAKYWAEHRDEISKQRKKYYQKNKEEIKARSTRWFQANRDRWNKYQRERARSKRKEVDNVE